MLSKIALVLTLIGTSQALNATSVRFKNLSRWINTNALSKQASSTTACAVLCLYQRHPECGYFSFDPAEELSSNCFIGGSLDVAQDDRVRFYITEPLPVLQCSTGQACVIEVADPPVKYWTIETAADFNSARQFCATDGGDLAVVNNRHLFTWIAENLALSEGSEYWVGLQDLNGGENFSWIDGSPRTWAQWTATEPNINRQEPVDTSCVRWKVIGSINDNTYGFADNNCMSDYFALCAAFIQSL